MLSNTSAGQGFTFYLGVHHPEWLDRVQVPLFVSRNALGRRKRFPRALGPWALDSSAFTEIAAHGKWTISESEYTKFVVRCRDEVGNLQWAAPMDWMCEPQMLQKTGLTVKEHQARTIGSYMTLRSVTSCCIPVLQGWTLGDYLDHVEAYDKVGVDLRLEPLVGLGSVCRRQGTMRIWQLVSMIAGMGIRLHGFGIKTQGLDQVRGDLVSSDSMSWSFHARKIPPLSGHTHKNCANCLEYALGWRQALLGRWD